MYLPKCSVIICYRKPILKLYVDYFVHCIIICIPFTSTENCLCYYQRSAVFFYKKGSILKGSFKITSLNS